jgi:tRNA(adenine34) deaminase
LTDEQRSVDDERFMREALREAERAATAGEVPVGCVLVRAGEVIARGRNLREAALDPSAHAELVALRSAAARLRSWRLLDVTCYATLEPCPMCAGALVNARVARLVYGCDDPKAGAVRTLYSIGQDPRLNHRFELSAGVLAEECAQQLSSFFAELRARR